MIRITHPRPELGRQSALGIDFRDGVAEVEELHPERERALNQHGFTLTEPDSATPPPKPTKRSGRAKPVKLRIVDQSHESAPASTESGGFIRTSDEPESSGDPVVAVELQIVEKAED